MVIDTVAGIFMGLTEEMLITLSVVLLLIPVFNAEGETSAGSYPPASPQPTTWA